MIKLPESIITFLKKIRGAAITDEAYLFSQCGTDKLYDVYEDLGYFVDNKGNHIESEYQYKGTGIFVKSIDKRGDDLLLLKDINGRTRVSISPGEVKSGYWIVNETTTGNRLDEIDLEYGLVKKYNHSELWYEPFTDEINGFILYDLDNNPISMYTKVIR